MAFDAKTYEILHNLTPEGQKHYQEMLEDVADEILLKHEHPFKWIARKFISIIH